MMAFVHKLRNWLHRRKQYRQNAFLKKCSGVIHVGANVGQERHLYASHGLKVVWIEPIPEIFAALQANLIGLENQIAVQSLITDKDNERRTLHIATNNGASSSLLELNEHKDIWPDVGFSRDIELISAKLSTALRTAQIDPQGYDALIMDTQGTELLVLKGAREILPYFDYIKTEAADFEIYKGCATVAELDDFLSEEGFRKLKSYKFAERRQGGTCFDVLYERIR